VLLLASYEILQYLLVVVLGNGEQDGLPVNILDARIHSPLGQQFES
jgi:hypothetical protein